MKDNKQEKMSTGIFKAFWKIVGSIFLIAMAIAVLAFLAKSCTGGNF